VYDVSTPAAPTFVTYLNMRTGPTGDRGPEGLMLIKADESPNGKPLLIVGNDVYHIALSRTLSRRTASKRASPCNTTPAEMRCSRSTASDERPRIRMALSTLSSFEPNQPNALRSTNTALLTTA
jgi:hypothetical protein